MRTRAEAVAKVGEGELAALREKEKLPWVQLSNAEKSQLYRASYGQTRREVQQTHALSDTPKVVMGVVIGLAVSLITFKALQSRAGPSPKTLSDEWKAATKANAAESGANPLH
jgi:hypothetical protein